MQEGEEYDILNSVSEAEKRKVAQNKTATRTIDSKEITVQIRILINKENVSLSGSESLNNKIFF